MERLLDKNNSLISSEERYQLALERIHLLNRELALRDLELEKLRESRYCKEEYKNSTSLSSYEFGDSGKYSRFVGICCFKVTIEAPPTRDGHFQETGESHNRLKTSTNNTSKGIVGNLGFSVIQVFLIVLISFFFGKVCYVLERIRMDF